MIFGVFGEILQPSSFSSRSANDSCWSRRESEYYFKNKLPEEGGTTLSRFLRHYSRLHKKCTDPDTVARHLDDNFDPSDRSQGDPCKYVVHRGTGGFGNRLQGLLSSFLYGLLTNRTLIVLRGPDSDETLFCEPFSPSSWMLGSAHQTQVMQGFEKEFQEISIEEIRNRLESGARVTRAAQYTKYNADDKQAAFFCESGQRVLKNVTWVILNQVRYLAPVFAVLPTFQKEMERLFPDRLIFSRLARFLLHPKNLHWDHITRIYRAHLHGADKLLGIQIRTFTHGNEWAVPRIMTCLTNISRALPTPISQESLAALLETQGSGQEPDPKLVRLLGKADGPRVVKAFVTSLQAHHLQSFKKLYEDGSAEDGSVVSFHAEYSAGSEEWTLAQHITALYDVWLLSFSDVLFTSAHSTFGYVASTLAGVRPWILNIAKHDYGFENDPDKDWHTNGRPACAKSASADPCGLPVPNRPCAGSEEESFPKYLKQTCFEDFSYYWQLVSDVV